ncbi:MAG TPA: MMPL family transporter [Jiangellaceae bacterium]
MSRLLYRLGKGAARHPWRVILLWVAALAAFAGLAVGLGGPFEDDFSLPGTGSQRATDLLTEHFPAMSGADARVVAHSDNPPIDERAAQATAERLWTVPHVSDVGAPVFSGDERTVLISVQYDVPADDLGADSMDRLESAAEPLRGAGYQVALGGQVAERFTAPDGRAELIGVAAALVILLIAFGSFVAAGLPLAIAAAGLAVGSAGITLLAGFTDVATTAPTLATMVGLGVGIDYALFLLTRHRSGLAAGLSFDEAAGQANATAGQSVVFAGATVLVAISGLAFSGIGGFATMGYATAIVVFMTVIAAVTLLPALLGLAKSRLSRRRSRGVRSAPQPHSRAAARLAMIVGARPLPWLLGSLVVLLALAAPALGMRIGESDAGNEPESNTARQAYDLVADAFGPGANGPFVVAFDLADTPASDVTDLAAQLRTVPGVAAVSEPVVSGDESAAVLTVSPSTSPQDDRTVALLETLRADVLPAAAEVTGMTAATIDMSDIVEDHLWVVIGAVLAASLVLLLLAFRSLVVALKATLVNLLSVGAAYGVITLIFQTETGARLVGLPGEVPVSAFVPLFMFAILFGLSMDYHVFLLGSVREEWLRTGQNRQSVVTGLASTARVISSAALIMVVVFLGFAFDPGVEIKMMGVGLAAAIALDATLVRLVLVPAGMALLGSANWYLPRWLDRVLPRLHPHTHHVAGVAPAPQPAMSSAG